jgi:REP element-mobilizing transposase RayT
MPRRTVDFGPGHYYHLYNRGVGRTRIFRDHKDYLLTLQKIKRYLPLLDLTVIAYCLMPNHYHLLIRQDGDQAAGLLPQRVFNGYVKAFNARHARSGTLFEDRYQAIHVDGDAYLVYLCTYIHANPIKAGLVDDLRAWPYSNYPEWTGSREGTLVDHEFVRAYFPEDGQYRACVDGYVKTLVSRPEGVERYLMDE